MGGSAAIARNAVRRPAGPHAGLDQLDPAARFVPVVCGGRTGGGGRGPLGRCPEQNRSRDGLRVFSPETSEARRRCLE